MTTQKQSGYRELDADDIALINEAKMLEAQLAGLYLRMQAKGANKRHLKNARVPIQTGIMWMIKSIAKPADPFNGV